IEKPITVPSGAFTKPPPVFTLTCPVSEWLVPTSFVAVGGLIWMCASRTCHVFCASTLSPGRPSPVDRVNDTPRTETVDEARTTVVPVVVEVICTVHDPVAPTVVQVLILPTKLPGPDRIAKLITVPAGAFTKPVPSFTFT